MGLQDQSLGNPSYILDLESLGTPERLISISRVEWTVLLESPSDDFDHLDSRLEEAKSPDVRPLRQPPPLFGVERPAKRLTKALLGVTQPEVFFGVCCPTDGDPGGDLDLGLLSPRASN